MKKREQKKTNKQKERACSKACSFYTILLVYYISYMSTAPGRSKMYPGAEHAHTTEKNIYLFLKNYLTIYRRCGNI